MSYLWLFIYILFVVLVVAFFFWSAITVLRQKKTWSEFAKKHDLIYRKPARIMDSASVEGVYHDYRINLLCEAYVDQHGRGMQTQVTVLEVLFNQGMPCAGAIGNVHAAPTVEYLRYGTPYVPKMEGWNKNHLITAVDHEFLAEYLNNARLEKINKFLNMPNATTMFVFDGNDSFLRVEIKDPMMELEKLERLVNKLVRLGDSLKLSPQEKERWLPTNKQKIPPSEDNQNEESSQASES